MIINSGMARTGMFGSGNRMNQGIDTKNAASNKYGSWMNASQGMDGNGGVSAAKSAAEKRRMLSRDKEDEQDLANVSRLLEQSRNYAESLRKARTQKKNTTQKVKKLRYSYKSISSQLLRSRTSIDASRVARKARRQLVMLKGKRLHENGKYDSAELEAAINHAQAMVRVARKKVKHLQEEEMVKIKGGPCAGELEEREGQENELTEEERDYLERLSSGRAGNGTDGGIGVGGTGNEPGSSVVSQEDVLQARQEWAQTYEEVMSQSDIREEIRMIEQQRARERSEAMADAMSDLADEMSDFMQELLEEIGLSELAENTAKVEVDMDPADYKMMKLKHRLEEMRAIAEADAKYLKAMFNKLEKSKQASAQAASSSGSDNNSAAAGGIAAASNTGGVALAAAPVQAQAIDVVSAPDAVSAVAAAPVEGGSVDVSV